VAEEAADESSGLFGGLVAGLGGGTGLAAGAAVVGLAALGGGGGDDAASGSSTATDASGMSGSNSSGTGTGGTGDGVGDNMSGGEAGMFTGGAQSLTDAAPIDAIPTAGPAIEGGLVSGAGQLDANSPASASGSPADADNASTAGADAALVALPTQAGSAPDDDSLGMLLDSAGASGISSTAGPDLSGTALPAPPV
jgi:hypothetical protein